MEQNAPFDRNTHLIQITSVTQKIQIHKSQLNIISSRLELIFANFMYKECLNAKETIVDELTEAHNTEAHAEAHQTWMDN